MSQPSKRCLAVVIFLTLFAGFGTAQRRSTAKTDSPRALTEEQVAQRLQALKSGLLLQIMPEKKRGLQLQERRWLADFHAIQTEHYLLFTNSSRSMANKFSKGLEGIYDFVQKEFPFEDIDELLTCYIFNVAEEYYRFCEVKSGWSRAQAENSGGHAHWSPRRDGGYESYYATHYMSPTADVVTHEASHQIVSTCLGIPGVGSWFQEGVATYLEKKKANDKPSAAMRTDLRNGDYQPLEAFFSLSSLAGDPRAAATRNVDPALLIRRNYTHSGAFIDFLVNTKVKSVAGRFPEFLAAAKERSYYDIGGTLAVQMFRDVYDLSPSELEQLWKEHHGLRRRR